MRFEPENLTVEVHHALRDVEPVWRELEQTGITTVYQTYDWVDTWQRHIGTINNVEPMIVIGRVWGQPVFLWPMGVCQKAGIRIAQWMGGSHSNYNLGVYAPQAMLALDADRMELVLREAAHLAGIDLFMLQNQPEQWCGLPNPLNLLDNQPSPSNALSVKLDADFDSYFSRMRSKSSRRKLRRKERFLSEAGEVEINLACSEAEIVQAMAVFHDQKAKQFADRGIHNLFHDAGVMEFFTELALRSLRDHRSRLEIYTLSVAGKPRAVWAGGEASGRFSGMFNSISTDELTHYSPGSVLMMELLDKLMRRGVSEFDLGIGVSDYKTDWCDREDTMFDNALPMTKRGLAGAGALAGYLRLRRFAKNTPIILNSYNRIRKLNASRRLNSAA